MTLATARRLGLAASGVVAILILVLTLIPGESVPDAPGGDKLHHLLAFAALVFPVVAVWPRAAVWVVPAAIVFGAAIEVIQPFVGRHGEWADLLANALGALIGAGLGWLAHGALRRIIGRG